MARVLIVDDSKVIREILKRELGACGHAVVGEAAGGREAVRLFKSLSPDLVLMDITLDDMDGLEAGRTIRETAPQARIVIVTALPRENVAEEIERLGVTGFIAKPFTAEEFKTALAGLA